MQLVSVLCLPVSSIPTLLSFFKSFYPCTLLTLQVSYFRTSSWMLSKGEGLRLHWHSCTVKLHHMHLYMSPKKLKVAVFHSIHISLHFQNIAFLLWSHLCKWKGVYVKTRLHFHTKIELCKCSLSQKPSFTRNGWVAQDN